MSDKNLNPQSFNVANKIADDLPISKTEHVEFLAKGNL